MVLFVVCWGFFTSLHPFFSLTLDFYSSLQSSQYFNLCPLRPSLSFLHTEWPHFCLLVSSLMDLLLQRLDSHLHLWTTVFLLLSPPVCPSSQYLLCVVSPLDPDIRCVLHLRSSWKLLEELCIKPKTSYCQVAQLTLVLMARPSASVTPVISMKLN